MSVKRWLLLAVGCSLFLGCGGGGSAPPEQPVGSEEPQPDPQQPQSDSQNPAPDPQTPRIPGQEPLPNGQDPLPAGSPQTGGEGGASPGET